MEIKIKDWVEDFLNKHRAHLNPHDWPPIGSDENAEYMKGWITAFALNKVTPDEADVASRRLVMTPPRYRREHIPMMLDTIRTLRAERKSTAQVAGMSYATLQAARDASRGCEYCGGGGLASVYHRWPSAEHGIAPTAAAYCVCAAGRHVLNLHRTADNCKDLLNRIPDLDCVLNGVGSYVHDDPSPGSLAGVPSRPAAPGPRRSA